MLSAIAGHQRILEMSAVLATWLSLFIISCTVTVVVVLHTEMHALDLEQDKLVHKLVCQQQLAAPAA